MANFPRRPHRQTNWRHRGDALSALEIYRLDELEPFENGTLYTTFCGCVSSRLLCAWGLFFAKHFHSKFDLRSLDLELSPLEFFESLYPNDPLEDQRKYLGRFGLSGRMQVQKMKELSDGQKTRVVFAKL
jgi:hypothetical protein